MDKRIDVAPSMMPCTMYDVRCTMCYNKCFVLDIQKSSLSFSRKWLLFVALILKKKEKGNELLNGIKLCILFATIHI